MTISNLIRTTTCPALVPHYQEHLQQKEALWRKKANPHPLESQDYATFEVEKAAKLAKTQAKLKDPLKALQQRVAKMVEKQFLKNGERSLVLGCMHCQNNALFLQTQTPAFTLFPTNLSLQEDHRHEKAVAIDLRSSPDECAELDLGETKAVSLPPCAQISAQGPDFARRDVKGSPCLEDFKFLKGVDKIYAERLPFLEKGASDISAVPFFKRMRALLAQGGILAFDYFPAFQILDHQMHCLDVTYGIQSPAKTSVKGDEIEAFLHRVGNQRFFEGLKEGEAVELAAQAVAAKGAAEEMRKALKAKRDAINSKPKAVLSASEIYISIGGTVFPLAYFARFSPEQLSPEKLLINSIKVKTHPNRSQEERESLTHQISCLQALHVDPSLLSHVHAATKEEFERAVTMLVEKVVFPQLKTLGFDRVSFDLKGQNPENKRPFSRVIYTKKI